MNNKFSENIKKIRKDNNLSQEQLADEIGVSRQAISKWESASAYPEMDKIILLCDKFNLNIDDLLHKDIKEVKGEEEVKNNINKYIEEFLKFITSVINLFSNMSFKSKFKCLFEQLIISIILFIIFLIIGTLGQELISGILGLLPDRLYYFLYSILRFIFVVFALISSVIIILHIFKTRYLDYFEKIKKEVENEEKDNDKNIITEEKIDKKNKIYFKKNEDKIIIRDPKHSEYRFINGLFKCLVFIVKSLILGFSCLLILSLIFLSFTFIASFVLYKTELFFLGLLVLLASAAVINVLVLLLLLNFVFNRKTEMKKVIYTFITSLIIFGFGCGFCFIGFLDFKEYKNDELLVKDSINIEMNDYLYFDNSNIEYIVSDNNDIKIEYDLNKYYRLSHYNLDDNVIYLCGICNDEFLLFKEIIKEFNNKKIIYLDNEVKNIKIYTNSNNIEILKNNKKKRYDYEDRMNNLIDNYEKDISKLNKEIYEYKDKEISYINEINRLKEELESYK